MRLRLLSILLLAAPLVLVAQTPNAPRELLALAQSHYDFNAPGLKPFHLKATYQLYGAKGQSVEQGTWEYWWASPVVHRSTWNRPSAARTDWAAADGKFRRTQSGEPLKYVERTLVARLLDPLPDEAALLDDRKKVFIKDVSAGADKFPCIVLEPRSASHAPGVAGEDRYCFQPGSGVLLLSSENYLNTLYSHIFKTQDRLIAGEMEVFVAQAKALSVKLDSIQEISPTDPALAPPVDAAIVPPVLSKRQVPPQGHDAPGTLAKKIPPHYPEIAKIAHIQGLVLLGVTITADGKVRDIDVLESPDAALSSATVDSVRQWQYRPVLLNGTPAETEAVINITYTLGG
jgi:TonB family protein